tara:strand:- start:326 stop:502 length:177 start_codon:yes stop_codon:yes gene_type:complete
MKTPMTIMAAMEIRVINITNGGKEVGGINSSLKVIVLVRSFRQAIFALEESFPYHKPG